MPKLYKGATLCSGHWISAWLAVQGVLNLIQGFATMISEIGYLCFPSRFWVIRRTMDDGYSCYSVTHDNLIMCGRFSSVQLDDNPLHNQGLEPGSSRWEVSTCMLTLVPPRHFSITLYYKSLQTTRVLVKHLVLCPALKPQSVFSVFVRAKKKCEFTVTCWRKLRVGQ